MPQDNEENPAQPTSASQPQINKAGGSVVGKDVNVKDGTFVGRDNNEGATVVDGNLYEGLQADDFAKIADVFFKHFQETAFTDPGKIDAILSSFKQLQAQLLEWKELHNYLDTMIQKYDQFLKDVNAMEVKNLNLRELKDSWFPIYVTLDNLLDWASKISVIGEKYSDDNGTLHGARWATFLEETRRDIDKQLAAGSDIFERSSFLGRLRISSQTAEQWIERLGDLASRYKTLVLSYMHEADDHVRDTAVNLIETSEQFMRK